MNIVHKKQSSNGGEGIFKNPSTTGAKGGIF
jgi:hypothetical protein